MGVGLGLSGLGGRDAHGRGGHPACPTATTFRNTIRTTTASPPAGRTASPSAAPRAGRPNAVAVELASEARGLYGKVDCVRRRDGSHLPYEHKRGRPARGADNAPEAWPSDRLQVVAYAVLLEDAFGQPVPEGRIRYHAANVTVRVPVDDRARADLAAALDDARRLRDTTDRPPIADNARLCETCSLAPVCLPEEVRQDREPERDPVRLFPPDRDGATLHVATRAPTSASAATRSWSSRGRGRRRSTRSAGSTPSWSTGSTRSAPRRSASVSSTGSGSTG